MKTCQAGSAGHEAELARATHVHITTCMTPLSQARLWASVLQLNERHFNGML